MRNLFSCVCQIIAVACVLSTSLDADDFRMKSMIYSEAATDCIATNWTIFSAGKVFDFRHDRNATTAAEITVFDPAVRAFTLMNPSRRLATMVSQDDLSMFTAQLKAEAVDPKRQKLDFLINPDMKVSYVDASKRITIACEKLTYSAVGIAPKDETAISAYRNYADWMAQLSTTRGGFPPFVRMRLNRELATRKMIPDTISRSTLGKQGGRSTKSTMRSEHDVTWTLTAQDRQRVQQAEKLAKEFKSVTFAEYRSEVAKVAARRK